MRKRQFNLTVRKEGRSYGVYAKDQLIEGGFFTRHEAEDCADRWEENYRKEALKDDKHSFGPSGY